MTISTYYRFLNADVASQPRELGEKREGYLRRKRIAWLFYRDAKV